MYWHQHDLEVHLCNLIYLVDVNVTCLQTTEATLDAFHDVMAGQSKSIGITTIHCSTNFSCYNKLLPQIG